MKTAKEERIFYNKAWWYELSQKYQGWLIPELLVKYLVPFLLGNERILDVGCGPGLVGDELKAKGWNGVLLGVDVAENRLKGAILKPSYAFCVHADAYHLPFRKQSFDVVISSAMVGLTGVKSIKEMYDLVKRGGYFACVSGEIKSLKWCRKRFERAVKYFNQLSQRPDIQKIFYKDLGSGYLNKYSDEYYVYYIFRKRRQKWE